jgi:hypothetical protein
MLAIGLLPALAAQALAAPTSSSSVSPSSASTVISHSYLTTDGFNDQKWTDAFEKAKQVVSEMTLYEKSALSFPSSLSFRLLLLFLRRRPRHALFSSLLMTPY